MYKFSGPNKWMDEEEHKTLQNDEVLFKIQADDPEQLLQNQINLPLAKIINADSFNCFTYEEENNFQTLVTTQGISTAYALSFE